MIKLQKYKRLFNEENIYKSFFKEASIGKTNMIKAFELYRKLLQKRLKKSVYTSGVPSDFVFSIGEKVLGVMYYIGSGKNRIRMNIVPNASSIQLVSIDFWNKMTYNPQLTMLCSGLNVIQILDLIVETIIEKEMGKTQIFTEKRSSGESFELLSRWVGDIGKDLDYLKSSKVTRLYSDFEKWDKRFGKSGMSQQMFRINLGKFLTGKGIKNKNTAEVSIIKANPEKRIETSEEKHLQQELEKYKISEEDLKGSIKLLKTLVQGLGVVTSGIIVTGTPGVGKTYTTLDVLENYLGKKLDSDYVSVTGTISPIELFKTLHDNRDKTIILDDCDAVFKNQDSVNMLKGALQTQGLRRVSYSKASITGKKDDEGMALFENPFEFSGQIIAITNLKTSELALISPVEDRMNQVHFNISQADLISYVEEMLSHIYPHVSMEIKKYIFDFFKKFGPYYKSAQKKGISIRSYTKTLDLAISGMPEEAWKTLALNTL